MALASCENISAFAWHENNAADSLVNLCASWFPSFSLSLSPSLSLSLCHHGITRHSHTSLYKRGSHYEFDLIWRNTQLFISIPVFLCILHFLRLWVLTLCAVFSSSPFAHGKTPNWFRETRCVWMSARTRKEKNKTKKKKKKSTVITAIVSALQLRVIFFFFPSLSWHRNQV